MGSGFVLGPVHKIVTSVARREKVDLSAGAVSFRKGFGLVTISAAVRVDGKGIENFLPVGSKTRVFSNGEAVLRIEFDVVGGPASEAISSASWRIEADLSVGATRLTEWLSMVAVSSTVWVDGKGIENLVPACGKGSVLIDIETAIAVKVSLVRKPAGEIIGFASWRVETDFFASADGLIVAGIVTVVRAAVWINGQGIVDFLPVSSEGVVLVHCD